MSKDKKIYGIHISHNDADGVGAAVVSNYLLPNVTWDNRFCKIGDQDDIINGILDDIANGLREFPTFFFITDISISEETLEKFTKLYKESIGEAFWHGWDHHKTNPINSPFFTVESGLITPKFLQEIQNSDIMSITGLGINISDDAEKLLLPQPVSATYLIYDSLVSMVLNDLPDNTDTETERAYKLLKKYMLQPEKMSAEFVLMVIAICRYDTWTWKDTTYGNSNGEDFWDILCDFSTPEFAFDLYMKLVDITSGTFLNDWGMAYHIVNAAHQAESRALQSVKYRIRLTTVAGQYVTATFIGDDQYHNVYAEYIRDNMPYVDLIMILDPRTTSISFRSGSMKSVDCSVVARRLFYSKYKIAGGGHPGASGIKFPPEKLGAYYAAMGRYFYNPYRTIGINEFKKKMEGKNLDNSADAFETLSTMSVRRNEV